MIELKRKKNCHNCKHCSYESSDEEYTSSFGYFVCEKREDDGYNNLENNLCKKSYLEKAKVCCELSVLPVEAKCIECGDDDTCWPDDVDNHICFDCHCQKQLSEGGTI